MHEIFTFLALFFKITNEKNITHPHPIFYERLLTFPMHVCMLQVTVVCYTMGGGGGGGARGVQNNVNRQLTGRRIAPAEYFGHCSYIVLVSGEKSTIKLIPPYRQCFLSFHVDPFRKSCVELSECTLYSVQYRRIVLGCAMH
jgi:hypothetical protein